MPERMESTARGFSMKDIKFRVILEGRIRDGHDPNRVIETLSALFKKNEAFIKKLVSGKPRVLKTDIDEEKALKYQRVLEKTGVACRIEPVPQPKNAAKPRPDADNGKRQRLKLERPSCPRCGYAPDRDDDVLITRGDCPKCGFLAKQLTPDKTGFYEPLMFESAGDLPTLADRFASEDEEGRDILGGRETASWNRRALASFHSVGLFLIVYAIMLFSLIFLFVPMETIPETLGKKFVKTVLIGYPIMLAAISILLVALVPPMILGGRSWGQWIVGIEPLFDPDGQAGGLYLSLGLRAAAALFLSFVPGLAVKWFLVSMGVVRTTGQGLIVLIAIAAISWALSWTVSLAGPLGRGIIDLAAGTIQTEQGVMPADAARRTLIPFLAITAFLMLFSVILPLVLKAWK
jgi:ribosomal protein S27AE